MTFFKYIEGGGIIGYVILALSIVGMAFTISAILRTRRTQLVPEEQVKELRLQADAGDFQQALDDCRTEEGDTFLGRIAAAGIDRSLRGPLGGLEARAAMEDAGEDETARLFRMIDPIAVIASVAPLLGLLGTVQGMIGAFDSEQCLLRNTRIEHQHRTHHDVSRIGCRDSMRDGSLVASQSN